MRRHPFAAVNLISDPIHGYLELTKRLEPDEAAVAGLPEEDGLVPDAAWKRRAKNEAWFPGDEDIERRLRRSARNGLNQREYVVIDSRIRRLEQRIFRDAHDGNRYGYNDRRDNWSDRDRDGRNDRYEDDRGRDRD